MIDSHCHLNFHRFEKDTDEVIKRAFEAGIKAIVNVGTKIDSSQHAVQLAEQYENLYAVVGVHPHHADKPNEGQILHFVQDDNEERGVDSQNDKWWVEQLEEMAKHPKVIGIGECGMDFFSYQSNGVVDPKLQEDIFRKQIELSIRAELPLQIHNRQAGKEVLRILSDYKQELQNPPGMFHCFAGDHEVLKGALDLGFYIGFDGNITYPGLAPGETVELSALAKQTPPDRILIETDSPYLTPVPHRGTRNEPQHAIITAQYVAQLKGIEYQQFEEQIDTNFAAVFTIPKT